jgi:choline dehydrogenase-like flavoprotein
MVAYQPASPMRFGRIYREQLGSSPTVTTWLHARATDVVLSDDHTRVAAVRVRTSAGGTFAVNARAVVLAAGAIENARLLLASCTQQTDGIGNGRGVVGRFYMDHPKGPCGLLHVSSRFATLPHPRYSLSHRGLRFGVRLSDGAQARLGVLDSYVRLTPMFIDDATRPALAELARRRVGALRDRDAVQGLARDLPALTAHSWFRVANRGIRMTYEIRNFLEQEPRRESRVELSDRRDALGELLPRVTWSLSELDRRSIVELHRALALDVEARGIGRMESPLLSQDWAAVDDWPIAVDAAHHLGTTRMGTSLATSVTDPDGQVHGVANLFVSGGSLFPTSGYANPTLTIIALALRQSEHLARTLGIEVT